MEQFEFVPDSTELVLSWMSKLDEASDGWMNLLPGLTDGSTRASTGLFGGFSALIGQPTTMSTMGTYLPPKRSSQPGVGASIGLLHPCGSHGMGQLSRAGLDTPPTWKVRQDHSRRGIVLELPPGTLHSDAAAWLIEACTLLCRVQLTGSWQAVVYRPQMKIVG